VIDVKREDEREENAGQSRTFTEEQSAIFSNPHGTPEAARPRTPGAESVAPNSAEVSGGGGDEGDADRGGNDPA
jgi:hypothetical protein